MDGRFGPPMAEQGAQSGSVERVSHTLISSRTFLPCSVEVGPHGLGKSIGLADVAGNSGTNAYLSIGRHTKASIIVATAAAA